MQNKRLVTARRAEGSGIGAGERRQRTNDALNRAVKPVCERLESRVMLSTVTWTAPGSGQWSNPANWSGDSVPGAGDDVVINHPGNITITSIGTVTVNSISVLGDTLEVSDGSITVAANSSVDSASTLLLDGGTLSVASGATFTQNGPQPGAAPQFREAAPSSLQVERL